MSGFPWLAIGYTQTPPSPLAGFAPVVGVYGLSFLLVAMAAFLVLRWRKRAHVLSVVVLVSAGMIAGFGLARVEWTRPVGMPVSVRLLQPNIPQSLKWQPELLGRWLGDNLALVEANPAQLMVLPETTLPLSLDELPPTISIAWTRLQSEPGAMWFLAYSRGNGPPTGHATTTRR